MRGNNTCLRTYAVSHMSYFIFLRGSVFKHSVGSKWDRAILLLQIKRIPTLILWGKIYKVLLITYLGNVLNFMWLLSCYEHEFNVSLII